MRKIPIILILTFIVFPTLLVSLNASTAEAWSNGGYSSNPNNPDYGTHDWIAQHALDYLPNNEKKYITDHLSTYLYGTELPDLSKSSGGIGDSTLHHVYFRSTGTLQDDSAAVRAYGEYNRSLSLLKSGDYGNAAKYAGVMAHYIADVAVFGHVMGSATDWGAESHHNDYETYVNQRTSTYNATFNTFLSYDGSLDKTSTYNATKNLAYNTTFGSHGSYGCNWMDSHYDWNNTAFKGRCGESLNLAVNYVADVLHMLYSEYSTSWPTFHMNSSRIGFISSAAANVNTTLWTYTASNGLFHSSPAVTNERLYIGQISSYGSSYNKICSLNASTGALLWEYPTGGEVSSSPAVSDGRVYVGSSDSKVYCLNAVSGSLIWIYPTGDKVLSSPAIVEGRVYFGSLDYKVYCLSSTTGALIWSYTTGDKIYSSPAVSNGRVYIGSDDHKVYCLNATTGTEMWNYTTGDVARSSPSAANGKVYCGSDKVYCLNASTGTLIWSYNIGSLVESSPAVSEEMIYVGASNRVYCFNATSGVKLWEYRTGDTVYSSPAIAGSRVYVGSMDRKIYCLNASTGVMIWSYTTGNYVRSSPAVSDGRVYVGSYDGRVYAFGSIIVSPPNVNLNIRTLDGSGNLLPSCNVILYNVGGKISDSSGWANFTDLSPGNYLVTTRWQGNTVNQTSITIYETGMVVDLKCEVFSLTFSFKDNSGSTSITPSQVVVQAPNGTLCTLTSPSIPKVQNGTWTIKRIEWQRNNVVPTPSPTKVLASNEAWLVNTRVYSIDFSNSFMDPQGNKVSPNIDSFRLLCPNGTTTQPLQPRSYLIQNGTYTWKNIFWQSKDVTPAQTLTFNPVNGSPTINLTAGQQSSLLDQIIQMLLQEIQIGPVKIPLIIVIIILIIVVAAGRRRKK